MGVKLKPGAKILIGVMATGLIGFGLYQARDTSIMRKIIPQKKEAGNVSPDDFGTNNKGSNTATDKKSPDIASSDEQTINVGIVTWGGYAGGIVANNGFEANTNSVFYKKYGYKVRLVVIDDFAQSRAAFAVGGTKGGIDIVWSTVDAYALEYPQLAQKGVEPKAIMQYDWSRGGDAIAVTKDIKTIADLRGKKISVAQATPSHYFGLWALAQGNVKNNEVNWVFTTSAPEAANLFKAGKVDAAISWSPDVYIAAEARGKILISTREATNLIADIFIARGDFLQERPKAAQAFVNGWLAGVAEAKANPSKAIRLMAENFQGIGVPDAEGMWKDVYLPNLQENLNFFAIGAKKEPTGYHSIFDTAGRIWKKVGESNELADVSGSFDPRFLSAAKAQLPGQNAATKAAATFAFKPLSGAQKSKTAIISKKVSVFFPTGSSTLDENAKYIIDYEVAPLASTFGSAYIRIAGNTDNVGDRASNVALSQQRAASVRQYLINRYGFSANKFIVVGNGPDKPVAPNTNDEGRSRNRRTDFEVLPR